MNSSLKINKLGLFLLLILPSLSTSAQTCMSSAALAVPATTNHLVDNNNGTVSDSKTGLIWKKCIEGLSYDTASNSCIGNIQSLSTIFTWQEAFTQATNTNAGTVGENFSHVDWRVPNMKELTSIVELKCYDPAINTNAFPRTPALSGNYSPFLSSTPVADAAGTVRAVSFYNGITLTVAKNNQWYVRLVR